MDGILVKDWVKRLRATNFSERCMLQEKNT